MRAYALFMIMAAMLGVYTVLQKSDETAQRYKLAKLLLEEKKLDEEIVRENTRLAGLLSPQNLERLNQELNLGLMPLRKYQPGLEQQEPQDLYAKGVKRRVVQRQLAVPLPEFDAPAQPVRGGQPAPAGAVAQKPAGPANAPVAARRRDNRAAQLQERVQRINSLLAQQDAPANGNGNAAPALSAAARAGRQGR